MPFIVHNITKSTIVLSDLRAEIGPGKTLDLEKIAARPAIDHSHDLRTAIDSKRLRLCSPVTIDKPKAEKPIEVQPAIHILDEAKLTEVMRNLLKEIQPNQVQHSNKDVLDAVAALHKQLATNNPTEITSDYNIDPEQLAELQSAAIAKISEGIETSSKKSNKKVVLKNTGLGNLANELD